MAAVERDAKRSKVDPAVVQITAPKEAVEKRITALIERKQAERDTSNYEEFLDRRKTAHAPGGSAATSEMGSARTDAAQLQRSLQIRITQTYNAEGPLDGSNRKVLPSGTEARVAQLENYLDLKTHKYAVLSAPKDVYERLQRIEERVMELEKVAAVADLLRIHKGKGVDALLAELNGTAPPPAPVAHAPHSAPPVAYPVAAPQPEPAAAPKRPAAALSPPPAPAPRTAPEDPREVEERIAQLKEALRRKQAEKRQKLQQQHKES